MDYNKKTCTQLKVLCKEQGLSNYSKLKKDELVKLLLSSSESQEPVKIDPSIKKEELKLDMNEPIVNRGTGAGGANTNKNGKSFEQKTENESRLLSNGFVRKPIPGTRGKSAFYLEKSTGTDKSIIYLTQGGLKTYFAHFFKKELFRHPDEAYLFRDGEKYTLKVLEKKNQNVEGSVDTKLCTAHHFKREYQICLGPEFQVEYAFCVSEFLKRYYTSSDKKWIVMRTIHQEEGTVVLFGDDADYYEKLDSWLSS